MYIIRNPVTNNVGFWSFSRSLKSLDRRWKISEEIRLFASHYRSTVTRKKRIRKRQRMKLALGTVQASKNLHIWLKSARPETALRCKWISLIWYLLPVLSLVKHREPSLSPALWRPAFGKALFVDLTCSTFTLPHSAYSAKHPRPNIIYMPTTSSCSSLSSRTFPPTL